MERHVQINDWFFEVVTVRARKTPSFGKPYTSTATLNFINNTCYIEGMLAKEKDPFTRLDQESFLMYLQGASCDIVEYSRYKFDKRKDIKIRI